MKPGPCIRENTLDISHWHGFQTAGVLLSVPGHGNAGASGPGSPGGQTAASHVTCGTRDGQVEYLDVGSLGGVQGSQHQVGGGEERIASIPTGARHLSTGPEQLAPTVSIGWWSRGRS